MSRYKEIDPAFLSIKDLALAHPSFGVAAGFYRNMRTVSVYGENPAVSGAYETLWPEGGIYVYPPAATVMKVSSSSAADDAVGTGAQVIHIRGLDSSYTEIGEFVELDGQTEDNTVKAYLRIEHVVLSRAGSGLTNAGIVYVGTGNVTTGKPAVVYNLMPIALGHSLTAVYTIPAQSRGYLLEYEYASSIVKAVSATVMEREFGGYFRAEDFEHLTDSPAESSAYILDVLEAKSDIELRALATGGGGDVSGHMAFWIEKLL